MAAETSPGWQVSAGGLTVRELRSKEKHKSESSGPLHVEKPEVVAASGSRATILPKWPILFAGTDSAVLRSMRFF